MGLARSTRPLFFGGYLIRPFFITAFRQPRPPGLARLCKGHVDTVIAHSAAQSAALFPSVGAKLFES